MANEAKIFEEKSNVDDKTLLHIVLPFNKKAVLEDINSYFSLDSENEFKTILKEYINEIVDEYVKTLKNE